MEIFGMRVILDPDQPPNTITILGSNGQTTYITNLELNTTMPSIFTDINNLPPPEPSPESTFWCSTCGRDISDTLILNCEGCGDDTCQSCAHILDSRDSIQLNEETVYVLCTDCLEGRE